MVFGSFFDSSEQLSHSHIKRGSAGMAAWLGRSSFVFLNFSMISGLRTVEIYSISLLTRTDEIVKKGLSQFRKLGVISTARVNASNDFRKGVGVGRCMKKQVTH